MTDPSFSASLERGLRVLSAFTGNRSVLGIADLARAVGLTKSTTHRYVATLTRLDYLQQDPETRKYTLGPRAADLGFAAIDSMDLTRLAGPPLQALADETGYTVSMALSDGPDVVYVDRRRSGRRSTLAMDLNLHVGSRLPAYCTAMGKVLLAYKDAAELRQILDRIDLARRGPKTITNREQLTAALARVRQGGVAVNDEELAPGLRSFAAPVRDRSGAVVAAVNVAVHLTVAPAPIEALATRIEPPLRRTTTEISRRLGFRPMSSE
ncbi:IclR family transcriptional regulator C-terminal domain-containing protein [Actinomadura meridiana]|uniref:IclR family transcriptional regulator C-terminal domain-containing protein n=1 Tax=Actinomadura meridiana TaxID=559626 RepID=A0ABP8C300_9ACTN